VSIQDGCNFSGKITLQNFLGKHPKKVSNYPNNETI